MSGDSAIPKGYYPGGVGFFVGSMERPEAVLREIERVGERNFIPVIGPEKGLILDRVIRDSKPRRVLEVGTFIGYSAIRIARLLTRGGKLFCIEKNAHHAEMARMNLERAGLSERVEIIVDDAKHAIPRLRGIFDVVFIDAEKSEYYAYLKLVEPRLHRGSILVADNAGAFARDMSEYLSYVRDSGKYESRYHESTMEFDPGTKDGVEVSTKL